MAVQQEFVEQLFETALALEASARAPFLEQACGEAAAPCLGIPPGGQACLVL